MEGFEKINNIQEQERVLNDWDKDILYEGGKNVITKIVNQEGIPDVIILPDTAARPLFYLLDPSFKKLSKNENIETPRYIFFATTRSDQYTDGAEEQSGWSDEDEKPGLVNLSKDEVYKFIDEINYDSKPEDLIKYKEEVDRTYENRIPMKEYANLLLNNIIKKYGTNPKVVIVDEFSYEGNTAREIQRAFGREIPAYSVFSDDFSDISKDYTGLTLLARNTPNNSSNDSRTRLSYKGGELKRSIGVEKHEGIATVTPLNKKIDFNNNDQKMISVLRDEMKELGKEIAKKF